MRKNSLNPSKSILQPLKAQQKSLSQVLEIFYMSSNCRHLEQEQGWRRRRQEVATGAITKGREEDSDGGGGAVEAPPRSD